MKYLNAVNDIRDGLHCRDLWFALGIQDIRQRYRRSLLGPFWLTISMAVMIGAMGPLYGALFKYDPVSFIPHLALGLIIWGFIAGQIGDFGEAFSNSTNYLRQMKLPLSMFVFRVMWRHTIILGHNILVYLVVWAILPVHLNASLLVLPIAFLIVLVNLFWMGIITSIFCTRYRDMHPVIGNLVQVMFFVTPIIWKAEQLSPERQHLIHFNPFFYLLELLREPLLGVMPEPVIWIRASVMAVVGLVLALLMLGKLRHRVTYWL
ncbi:ABC-2 type transport system permease protein/lipopolysaccharide transport system permease protein [Paraburkholderia caballeronis]|uniref:ABC transporter permease n=1 Tax=Paraburkholderia caballeronis TaxID=416943 RepID=UPI0010F3D5FD|nr:ABC transporter permease [Paraburkholderia caballeronis]TDV34732.1 ABC-2 type transport system permease protein/lipopolysaccharide transport system permease protein [Paraburkholderia caballeronis]